MDFNGLPGFPGSSTSLLSCRAYYGPHFPSNFIISLLSSSSDQVPLTFSPWNLSVCKPCRLPSTCFYPECGNPLSCSSYHWFIFFHWDNFYIWLTRFSKAEEFPLKFQAQSFFLSFSLAVSSWTIDKNSQPTFFTHNSSPLAFPWICPFSLLKIWFSLLVHVLS